MATCSICLNNEDGFCDFFGELVGEDRKCDHVNKSFSDVEEERKQMKQTSMRWVDAIMSFAPEPGHYVCLLGATNQAGYVDIRECGPHGFLYDCGAPRSETVIAFLYPSIEKTGIEKVVGEPCENLLYSPQF